MKKSFITLLVLTGVLLFAACNDYETYGDKKKKERRAISEFISKSNIQIISETQFHAQGDSTRLSDNEFVYLDNTGVYMQIVRQGCGEKLKSKENVSILCRFIEIGLEDSSAISNYSYPYDVDKIFVTKEGSSMSATFTEGLMMETYNSATVPTGWLVPLSYIKVGRPQAEGEEIAKVRLIVPHTQGHTTATAYTYPYYYEITYERDR